MNSEQLTINNGEKAAGDSLYSLIPIAEFKSLLGIDDREDTLCKFCLGASTAAIEQYCMRKFLRNKYFEIIPYTGDLVLPLREYPVCGVSAAYMQMKNGGSSMRNGGIIEPLLYRVVPGCGMDMDIPFSIELSPALRRYRGLTAVKVVYTAGYAIKNVPADLEAACLELAAWNIGRYRCKRIGMTGSVRKDGERWEMAMPVNVRGILETYKRRVI